MMKFVKKLSITVIICLSCGVLLTACTKHGKCDECGQEADLVKYVTESGETEWVCEFCSNMMKSFGE